MLQAVVSANITVVLDAAFLLHGLVFFLSWPVKYNRPLDAAILLDLQILSLPIAQKNSLARYLTHFQGGQSKGELAQTLFCIDKKNALIEASNRPMPSRV